MVRSLEIISVAAAAVVMGSTSAFAPTTSLPALRTSSCSSIPSSCPVLSPLNLVADAPAIERIHEETIQEDMLLEEEWHLILHNDKQNTKEWVAHALHFVVGLSEEQAYHIMQNAHKNGKAFVGTYSYDVAECYQRGMGKNGVECDVVPAEGFQ